MEEWATPCPCSLKTWVAVFSLISVVLNHFHWTRLNLKEYFNNMKLCHEQLNLFLKSAYLNLMPCSKMIPCLKWLMHCYDIAFTSMKKFFLVSTKLTLEKWLFFNHINLETWFNVILRTFFWAESSNDVLFVSCEWNLLKLIL